MRDKAEDEGPVEDLVFQWLQGYAYQPFTVYGLVALVMLLSSMGLPIPEEVSIISLGVLSYVGAHPELYPPPFEGAPHVQMIPSMLVCSISIYLSDFLIYSIGRKYGPAIFTSSWFQRFVPEKGLRRVKTWARKWGRIVPGLFRLIPGVRFPGHLLCGALGISRTVFTLVDGMVILIVVPTQIFFIASYGEAVIALMRRFQFVLVLICASILLGLFWNMYKLVRR